VSGVITDQLFVPPGTVASSPSLPDGNGGSVLQNAQVSPFTGDTSTNFTWTVTVYPQYYGNADLTPTSIHLYLSTCPGAVSNNTSSCSSSYLFKELTQNITTALTSPTNYTFHWTLGVVDIWDWQMALEMFNSSNHSSGYVYLVGDPTYNGIEGPIVGSFAELFETLLPTIYLDAFLFLGLPFYFVLLLYLFLKSRERRRKEARQRAAGPIPPTSNPTGGGSELPGAGSPAPPGSASGPPPGEQACPHCGAVVYPSESKCWKCGEAIGGTPIAADSKPLPPG